MDLGTPHADGYRELKVAEALAHRELRVIDVREEKCHDRIPRSEHFPFSALVASAKGWDRNQAILVVSEHNRTSASAAKALVAAGFAEVYVLLGGVEAWRAKGMPLESSDDEFEVSVDDDEEE